MIEILFVLAFVAIAIVASVFFLSLALGGVKTGKVPVQTIVYNETEEPILFWISVLLYFLVSLLIAAIPGFIIWEFVRAIVAS